MNGNGAEPQDGWKQRKTEADKLAEVAQKLRRSYEGHPANLMRKRIGWPSSLLRVAVTVDCVQLRIGTRIARHMPFRLDCWRQLMFRRHHI
jgi:hypothetical protein